METDHNLASIFRSWALFSPVVICRKHLTLSSFHISVNILNSILAKRVTSLHFPSLRKLCVCVCVFQFQHTNYSRICNSHLKCFLLPPVFLSSSLMISLLLPFVLDRKLILSVCVWWGGGVYKTVDLCTNACGYIFIPNERQPANSQGRKNKLATLQTMPSLIFTFNTAN